MIILGEADLLSALALQLPLARGGQNVPHPMASGDRTIPQHQKPTFEVSRCFIEAIVVTKTACEIISHEKYSMVDNPLIQVIDIQDRQWAVGGAPVCTPSVNQLPMGPSLNINLQTPEAVSANSVPSTLNGVIIIWNPKIYIVITKDSYQSSAIGRGSVWW